VLAQPKSICNLLIALALGGTLRHLKFSMRKQINLSGFDALEGWSAPECLEQKLRMTAIRPNLAPADPLDASWKFRQWICAAKHASGSAPKSSND
jgi:hypothetical protein